jgi:glycosyltransferase involved in cell wall biosynthesis
MSHSVTVIATVLNEIDAIDPLLASLLAQSRLPDEVVIVDGGSADGTWARLLSWQEKSRVPLKILRLLGCNIAQGRNYAIAEASSEVIAVTDAGVRLSATWLEALTDPFSTSDNPDVVSGFFEADPRTLFEVVLGAITLPRLAEVNPAKFHPSSRSVAFKRSAWLSVGGYPEWLDYCEDLVFDFALRDAGLRFAFAPKALVWFRPRSSLRAFYKQYYRYGRGDGKADLYLWRHLIRYGTYLLVIPGLILLAALSYPLWLVFLVFAILAIFWRPLKRSWPALTGLPRQRALLGLFWVPVIVFTGDIAKMLGYPAGVVWRRRYAPKKPWARRLL